MIPVQIIQNYKRSKQHYQHCNSEVLTEVLNRPGLNRLTLHEMRVLILKGYSLVCVRIACVETSDVDVQRVQRLFGIREVKGSDINHFRRQAFTTRIVVSSRHHCQEKPSRKPQI